MDVSVLTMLPLFGDTNAMGVIPDNKDQEKLDFLYKAISKSRSSMNKATYTWIRYFESGKGKNSKYQMLSY